MYDLLVTGGRLIDGSGAPSRAADIAVRDGRIAAIGNLQGESAARTIEADGRVVAPGFIDSHSHADVAVVAEPTAPAKSRQGVTTEIVGNCGWTTFPRGPVDAGAYEKLARPIFGHPTTPWSWDDLDGYNRHLRHAGVGVNVASLVGHGSVRSAVMGFEDRPPTAGELARMQAHVQDAMDAGAVGLSTGLCYPPGIYSDIEEVSELARVAARAGAPYVTHLRDQVDQLIGSVAEAIEIGRRSGGAIVVSHHKTIGARNFGKVRWTLQMLDEAHAKGQRTYCDTYPYIQGASTMVSILPPWLVAGGVEAMLTRLADPDSRARVARDFQTGLPGWENRVEAVGWHNIILSYTVSGKNHDLEGLDVAAAAAKRNKDPLDFVLDLMIDERCEVGRQIVNSCEEDLRMVMTHPRCMIGSDGIDVGSRPHPRQYGTFPRILDEYVRNKHVLALETAIHKMSGLTSDVFSLDGIGYLREGYYADLVVFDPERVTDNATFGEPRRHPDGIDWVFVGGVASVADGRSTGDCNGRVVGRRH